MQEFLGSWEKLSKSTNFKEPQAISKREKLKKVTVSAKNVILNVYKKFQVYEIF